MSADITVMVFVVPDFGQHNKAGMAFYQGDDIRKERDVISSAIVKGPRIFRGAIEQARVILYCTEGMTGGVKDLIGAFYLRQIEPQPDRTIIFITTLRNPNSPVRKTREGVPAVKTRF